MELSERMYAEMGLLKPDASKKTGADMSERSIHEGIVNFGLKQLKELDCFLIEYQSIVSDVHFAELKRSVGTIMSGVIRNLIEPSLEKFPELTPKEIDSSEFEKTEVYKILVERMDGK
ncbi:hypothetical protein [Mesorhizobium huakuii]|uniref:Uncharacterized protein n=1 Tax=Mesorhizobium huakuii TaxID=28104 RepID=A0ABZ0VP34_9HYPH|nr:hypothetical protein [Mesorhizobium huakuii]WQB99232.1 hypothetical protein U0R22_003408 [Mesorhizobium huakuii]